MGRAGEALALMRKAVELDPNYPPRYGMYLGRAYLFTRQPEAAVLHLRDAASRAPIFRTVGTGEHPELFNCLNADEQTLGAARSIIERVVNGRPIKLEQVLAGACSGHREAHDQ